MATLNFNSQTAVATLATSYKTGESCAVILTLLAFRREGFGIYRWASGALFKGLWMGGRQHGKGVYISKELTEISGLWANGKFVR